MTLADCALDALVLLSCRGEAAGPWRVAKRLRSGKLLLRHAKHLQRTRRCHPGTACTLADQSVGMTSTT